MPYLPNIPQAAQRINDTQPLIQTNFTLLNTYFGNNHVAFNAGADWGKHTVVQFVQQGAEPAAFAASEAGLYNLAYGGNPEIFVRKGVAAAGIPMTARSAYTPPIPGVGATNNWTYLPSGLILKFGNASAAVGGVPVVLNGIGPNYTQVPFVYVTLGAFAAGPAVFPFLLSYAPTAAQFMIVSDLNNVSVDWFTIGI